MPETLGTLSQCSQLADAMESLLAAHAKTELRCRDAEDRLALREQLHSEQVAELEARHRILQERSVSVGAWAEQHRIGTRKLEAKHTELAGRHESLTKQHTELAGRHESLTKQHAALTEKHSQLTEKHSQLTEKHETLTKHSDELKQRHGGLAKDLAATTERLTSTLARMSQLELQLRDTQARSEERHKCLMGEIGRWGSGR